MEAAAAAGHLHICQRLRQLRYPWGEALRTAARSGHRELCEWLLGEGLPCTVYATAAAAQGGHVDLMDWLAGHLTEPLDRDTLRILLAGAAEGCDLATLQRLHALLPGSLAAAPDCLVLASAAASPTPDWAAKVAWLEGQGCPRTADACCKVVRASRASLPDSLGRLQLLWQQQGYPVDEMAVAHAAGVGNLPALECLLSSGVQEGRSAELVAWYPTCAGQVESLRLLHAFRVRFHRIRALLRAAAEGGHTAVVAWMVETLGVGLEEDEEGGQEVDGVAPMVAVAAAESGSMELLVWLAAQGVRLQGEGMLAGAAAGGCTEALEWLLERGCPMPTDGQPYVPAALHGDLATLACLRRLGCPWGPEDTFMCCLCGDLMVDHRAPLPALQWLVEEGCPVDWAAALQAVESLEESDDVKLWVTAEAQRMA